MASVTSPIDVIKTRIMNQKLAVQTAQDSAGHHIYKGSLDCFWRVSFSSPLLSSLLFSSLSFTNHKSDTASRRTTWILQRLCPQLPSSRPPHPHGLRRLRATPSHIWHSTHVNCMSPSLSPVSLALFPRYSTLVAPL